MMYGSSQEAETCCVICARDVFLPKGVLYNLGKREVFSDVWGHLWQRLFKNRTMFESRLLHPCLGNYVLDLNGPFPACDVLAFPPSHV
jgi:hypothetical protein